MTTIYQIANPAESTTNYVCDSLATVDAGQAAGVVGTFSVGTSDDANTTLATNRTVFLTAHIDRFVVNKITVDSEGRHWDTVDLSTEPANTDVEYRLLNVPHGDYLAIVGLDNAQAKLTELEDNFLTHHLLDSYQTLTAWPTTA